MSNATIVVDTGNGYKATLEFPTPDGKEVSAAYMLAFAGGNLKLGAELLDATLGKGDTPEAFAALREKSLV